MILTVAIGSLTTLAVLVGSLATGSAAVRDGVSHLSA